MDQYAHLWRHQRHQGQGHQGSRQRRQKSRPNKQNSTVLAVSNCVGHEGTSYTVLKHVEVEYWCGTWSCDTGTQCWVQWLTLRDGMKEVNRKIDQSWATSRASSRALSVKSAGSRCSSQVQGAGATQPLSTVGQAPIVRSKDPGTSSTGGLPTFTRVPLITWVSSGAPLPVAAPTPVMVTQNVQSFIPYTPQSHTNVHVPPVVMSRVSVPHPMSSHAVHAQTHVPSSIYMPAPVSMPVTTSFTHLTHTVSHSRLWQCHYQFQFQWLAWIHMLPFFSQLNCMLSPACQFSPVCLHMHCTQMQHFIILFQLPGTFCPNLELVPRSKMIVNCQGSFPNSMAKELH